MDQVVQLFSTPADFMQAVCRLFYVTSVEAGFFTVGSYGITSFDGHPCIIAHMLSTTGGIDYDEILGLTDIIDSVGCPAGVWLIADGVNVSYTIGPNINTVDDYDIAALQWIDYLNNAVLPFFEGLFAITVTLIDTWSTFDDEWKSARFLAALRYEADDQRVWYQFIGITTPGLKVIGEVPDLIQASKSGTIPAFGNPSASGAASEQLARIAGFLEEIANQETDVSINNNASVFSAKSKVITGP